MTACKAWHPTSVSVHVSVIADNHHFIQNYSKLLQSEMLYDRCIDSDPPFTWKG
jgi:hypothetical protein